MKLKEAFDKFDTDDTVSILVRHKEKLMVLSDLNFFTGCCGCCSELGYQDADNLKVVRVVDLDGMKVLYDELDNKEGE